MKNFKITFVALAFSGFLYSCGSGENEAGQSNVSGPQSADAVTPDATATAPVTASAGDPVAEGKALVEGSDCRACHTNDQRLIGPAYKEVAERYQNDPDVVEKLAVKIIEGGSGNWGDMVMAPHPQFSTEDAGKMVQYIMTLGGPEAAPEPAPQTN